MNNFITMRPHHFLCLPGYKGISYNSEHATSWDKISKSLAQYPNMRVKITLKQDTLCKKCPNNAENKASCAEHWVKALDKKVNNLLNLEENKIYRYNEILQRVQKILNPHKHKNLCGDCEWRTYGLCKDTFKKILTTYKVQSL